MPKPKHTQPWYREDRNREIINLYCFGGETIMRIADRMGITKQRVEQILRAHGVPRRRARRQNATDTDG